MAKNSAKAVVEKVDLKSLFMGLQKTMAEELKTLRRNVTHPGSKGEACEQCWITLLKKYLPKRYSVEKAFVVDSKAIGAKKSTSSSSTNNTRPSYSIPMGLCSCLLRVSMPSSKQSKR
ncbi:MAG: hypothetical protein IPN85_15040 [Flavobacteriales bacterium]|nr:hypothetical protein [Flavobacteriales bacterium]